MRQWLLKAFFKKLKNVLIFFLPRLSRSLLFFPAFLFSKGGEEEARREI